MALDPKLTKYSTASQVLVNVDSGDFTTGLGYVEFFCFDTVDGTSKKFNILNKALRGKNKDLATGGSGAVTIEFTSQFGITQIMDGKAYVQVHWAFTATGSTTNHVTISLEKNGVELVSVDGEDVTHGTTNTSTVEIISFDIPNTTFSPGDIFKVKIVMVGSGANGSWIAFDPLDTSFTPSLGNWTGGTITDSVFKLNIPFKFI